MSNHRHRDVILLDCDGLIIDFANTYLNLLASLHQVVKQEADITTFHFEQCVATPEQNRDVWQFIESHPGLVYKLPAYEGAMDFLADLRKLGRVVACTSPANPTWTAERAQALQDRFGFAKRDVVVASDKALVAGEYLVDDAAHNTAEWQAGAGMGGFALLFSRPWNLADGMDKYWQRVTGYEHTLETIRALQED